MPSTFFPMSGKNKVFIIIFIKKSVLYYETYFTSLSKLLELNAKKSYLVLRKYSLN